MLTTNFKHAMATVLEQTGTGYKGLLPVVDYNGTRYWITGNDMQWATGSYRGLILNTNSSGVCVGMGDTPPTVDDYKLEAQITADLSGTVLVSTGLDIDGNPYLNIDLTLQNTGSESVTIKEIGYRQRINASTVQGEATGASSRYVLFDRTVLDEPVTIPAGENGVIRYTLKTIVA